MNIIKSQVVDESTMEMCPRMSFRRKWGNYQGCEKRGYSQEQLAEIMKVSRTTISKLKVVSLISA
jgi:hypothetical protein